jgi:hypothetical protein
MCRNPAEAARRTVGIFSPPELAKPELEVERAVGIGVLALTQFAKSDDREVRLFAALADGTRRSLFARQTSSARKLRAARKRLVIPAPADEVVALVLEDGDCHALDCVVSRTHNLPCISAGGAPMM